MNIKKITYIAACVATLLFLQGCSTQRSTAIQSSKADRERHEILQHIVLAQSSFQSAEVTKMRYTLTYADRQMAANGSLKFIKDSVISFSLQPVMGIELFRVDITPSQVSIVDKMNRRLALLTYPELSDYIGLTIVFEDIQALTMQHIFAFGKKDIWQQSFSLDKVNSQHRINFTDNAIDYSFLFDAVNYLLQETQLSSTQMNASVLIAYRNETQTDDVLFPETVDINYIHPARHIALSLTMLRRQFNRKVNYSPINTANYKLVDISTILP